MLPFILIDIQTYINSKVGFVSFNPIFVIWINFNKERKIMTLWKSYVVEYRMEMFYPYNVIHNETLIQVSQYVAITVNRF